MKPGKGRIKNLEVRIKHVEVCEKCSEERME